MSNKTPMTPETVQALCEQLRAAANVRSDMDAMLMHHAADLLSALLGEVERLTVECCELRLANGTLSDHLGEVERLRQERDDARRDTEAEHAAVLEKLKELEPPDTVDARLCPDCDQPFSLSFTERRVTCGCPRKEKG